MAPDLSNSSSSSFILVGVPGLEAFPTCLGVLFCLAYVTALAGNGAVLLVTVLDESLRAPSRRLLATLAAIDVLVVTAVVPRTLSVLWLDSAEVGCVACFAQMFLVHSVTSEESGLLLATAFDRYVAICHPLRYQTVLGARAIARVGPAVVLRGLLLAVPLAGPVTAFPGAPIEAKAAPAAFRGVPTASRSREQGGLLGFNETLLCEKSYLGLGERVHARPSFPSSFPDDTEKQEPTFESGDVPSARNIPVII